MLANIFAFSVLVFSFVGSENISEPDSSNSFRQKIFILEKEITTGWCSDDVQQLINFPGNLLENSYWDVVASHIISKQCYNILKQILPTYSSRSFCMFLKDDANRNVINSNVTQTLISTSCWADEHPHLDEFTYIIISILSGILTVTVLATVIYYFQKRESDKNNKEIYSYIKNDAPSENNNVCSKIVQIFSIHQNLKLWAKTKLGGDHIKCVDGIRFLSICWIILLFTFLLCPIQSTQELFQSSPKWSMYLILTAHFASETFFTTSALLLSYRTLHLLENKKFLLIPLIRRIVRFLPVYAVVIFTTATIVPFFRKHNSYVLMNAENCRKNWWTNLLFVNNLVHSGYRNACHPETWFLAADMQMFVASFIVIPVLWKAAKMGFLLIFILIAGAIACPIALTFQNNLIPSPVKLISQNLTQVQVDDYIDFYIKPWNRVGPYLIGIVGGYILHLKRNQASSKRPIVGVVGWIICTILALALIYGLHISHDSDEAIPKAGAAIYGGLHNISWSCIIVWIIIACHRGCGGWINDFLAWNAYAPLAKTTLSIFLVAANAQLVLHLFHHDDEVPRKIVVTGYFFAHLAASIIMALVLHVVVQCPFVQMGSFIVKPAQPPTNEEKTNKRVPRERHGIFYTGTDMEVRVDMDDGKGSKGGKEKMRLRPTERYGVYYDERLNRQMETVVKIK